MQQDTASELVKVAPPAGVGSLTLLSVPLNDWVVILTIIYTVLLIVDKLAPCVLSSIRDYLKRVFK